MVPARWKCESWPGYRLAALEALENVDLAPRGKVMRLVDGFPD